MYKVGQGNFVRNSLFWLILPVHVPDKIIIYLFFITYSFVDQASEFTFRHLQLLAARRALIGAY